MVDRKDMGFFPEEVFQNYNPVAAKKFFDAHSNDKPDQSFVHGAEKGELREYEATVYAGLARELPWTGDDEWEIRAQGTFAGGSPRKRPFPVQ